MDPSRPSKEDRLVLPLSTPLSFQAIDDAFGFSCARMYVSQAPQHFKLLVMGVLPAIYLIGHLPSLRHVKESTLFLFSQI